MIDRLAAVAVTPLWAFCTTSWVVLALPQLAWKAVHHW